MSSNSKSTDMPTFPIDSTTSNLVSKQCENAAVTSTLKLG